MISGQPNWTPVPRAPVVSDDIRPCGRCLHRASAHHDPTSCSIRGRWRRRCKCGGYVRSDAATPGRVQGPASYFDLKKSDG